MISSPKPPDPYEQASAQAGANIDSAVANDLLNNRTEITPTGRIDYIDQGTRTITDSQGKQREIPVRDRVITLSDGQQKILDLTEDTSKNLLDVAKDRSAFLSQYFEDGINTDDLTAWRGAPEAPKLDTSPISFGEMELYGGSGKDVLYGYEGSDTELGRVERPGDLLTSVPLKTDFSGISVSGGGGTSRVSGDIAGTGEGIQDTVDLNTSGGAIGSLKRDFNADRLSGEIAGAGPIRTDIGYDGPNYRHQTAINRFDTPLDGVGEVRRSLGVDDYAAERDDVEDAIMSRYNRHFAEVESQLDQKLRAQGLVPGSEAYDRQFRQMREMQTDASMQAILAGGQEQSRLFGLDRDAALFENSAQQQAHTQSIDRGRFGLDVNRQNNETTLAADRFFNESVGMSFQKALEEATFGNASQGQQFGQNLQQALTRMNAAERNATIAQMRAQLHNDAQRTFFEQTLANAGFGNRATLDMGDFVNRSQQQRFSQHAEETARRIAAGSVNNQAADIENRHAVAAANLELQAQQAENDALLAQAGFNNAAVTQGLTNDLSATGFNNAAALAEIDNAAAAAGFYNASQGQNYTQDLGLFGFNNAATQQNNQNTAAAQSAFNQYLAQQYGLDDASAAQNNALRQAQLQEEFALRGQPLNEIAALMSGSQLMMPQFTAPFQTGVPPVPIADYIQREFEARQANSAATAQGLFGLGSSFFKALPFLSDRRTKKEVKRIGELENGVPVYSFRYRHNDEPDVGIMADEVKHIPGAIETIAGIDYVHYAKVIEHSG